ncbi:MAG: fused MFS/spermidine synthase [Pseudomonadota bacterium]
MTRSPGLAPPSLAHPRSAPDPKWRIRLYLAVTAISAACGLIVEIVAGRIIAPYLGMSLYTWTAIIAVVLAGFSVGNWIGGRLASQSPAQAARATAISFALAALTTLAILPLLRIFASTIVALELPAVPTILILTSALFFAPSVFVGIPSPILTKLAVDEDPSSLGPLIGQFFAVGAVGSIVGTLAAGYLFISWLGSTATLLTVTAIYAILTIIMGLDARRRQQLLTDADPSAETTSRPTAEALTVLGAAFAVATLSLLALGSQSDAFTSNCDTESDYYCIRIRDASATFGAPSRILVLDHLGHGINLRDAPSMLVSPYLELQDQLTRQAFSTSQAMTAFFIGGGAYTLPRAWLARYPQAEITVAEIDPAVSETAQKQMWLTPSDRLNMLHRDARQALRDHANSNAKKLDVIVGDAFHDIAVPPHLVTREFYQLIRASLQPDGLYLMNVIDNPDRPRLVASVAKTLSQAFNNVEIWVSNETTKRATFVVRASAKPSAKPLLQSNVQEGLAWQRLSATQVAQGMAALNPVVLTDDHAPVDRLIGLE